MAITINGSGSISGISAGGLPDGCITADDIGSLPAGSVLQVVHHTTTIQTDIASTSYTDVGGFSIDITPSSSSSKILIRMNPQMFIRYDATGVQRAHLQFKRDGTGIQEFGNALFWAYIPFSSTALVLGGNYMFEYLDSPATTSQVTYTLAAKCADTSNTGRVKFNESGYNAVSTITLMEIAA